MPKPTRGARDIDAHIGNRVRAARQAQGMSQSVLANALGITFQQVQKYENGTNRVSAGRLYDVAHILGMPITYFYEGARHSVRSARPPNAAAARVA